ncbi:MAG: hypothetical protein ACHQIM_22960, partial [Sphingobacteriales bacterium]
LKYMSSTHKQGRMPTYEASFKIAVAREYLISSLGYGSLAVKYNLPSVSTVRFFVKWYKAKYPEGLTQRDSFSPGQEGKIKKSADKQLQQATLKITGLEMLIENASKELGIDLIKKFGAKQSKH